MSDKFKTLLEGKGNDEFDSLIYDDYYAAHKGASDRLVKKKYGSSIYGVIINNKGYKKIKSTGMYFDPIYTNNLTIAKGLAIDFGGKLLWFKDGSGSFYTNFDVPSSEPDLVVDSSNGKLMDPTHPYFDHRGSFDESKLRYIENNQYTSKIKPNVKREDFILDRERMTIDAKKLGFHFNNVLIKIVNRIKSGKSEVGNFTLDFGRIKFISYTYVENRNDLIIKTIIAPDYIQNVKTNNYELDIICKDVL